MNNRVNSYFDLFILFFDFKNKEKDRANDLTEAANFSEEICNDLVGITAAQDTPGVMIFLVVLDDLMSITDIIHFTKSY